MRIIRLVVTLFGVLNAVVLDQMRRVVSEQYERTKYKCPKRSKGEKELSIYATST